MAKKPMVAPKNFTRLTYTRSDMPNEELTFSQLCASFGLKYNSVYNLVTNQGMTVEEAVLKCIRTPSTWRQTYYNVPYNEQ